MVKSETCRDAKILVRNPSLRLFGEKFRDSKKVETNHEKMRLRDLSKTFPRFRDPAKIFRDSHFSRYHSPPLMQFSIVAIHSSKFGSVNHYLREKKKTVTTWAQHDKTMQKLLHLLTKENRFLLFRSRRHLRE